MCGDCFVCIYLVCQCDGLELGRRNRRITVRGVAVRINNLLKVQQEQLSPEDQKRVFGVDKLNTAYQKKSISLKSNLRLKSAHIIKMDKEKDNLKSI